MTETGGDKGSKAERLGYLGLGMMGIPMARRLVNAGYEVAVWNRSADKAKALIEAGARTRCRSPRASPNPRLSSSCA